MFKVTVSGDYRTSGGKEGNIVDFEQVVGIMPECGDGEGMENEDIVRSHVVARYLGNWIKADKRFTARYAGNRTTYIDNIEKVSGTPSCVGKDIKTLTWGELQDLAVLKNLFRIPAEHSTDLRAAREIAYIQYSKLVLGKDVNTKIEGYMFAKLPALAVASHGVAVHEKTKSNEEVIAEEQESTEAPTTFTREELKKMAKEKGIKVPPNIGDKKLEELVLGGKA